MDFECIKDCSQCCIQREYYPNKRFGKIGVLILPGEREKINRLARVHGIAVSIIPRIGASREKFAKPTDILAYQMMGRDDNGNTCPFLDTESGDRSPHGGYMCKIYNQRPLACAAYPLYESKPVTIDQKCAFCKECGQADGNLESETEALLKIKSATDTTAPYIWRYATGVGEEEDRGMLTKGWVREE